MVFNEKIFQTHKESNYNVMLSVSIKNFVPKKAPRPAPTIKALA
ncbi:unnamed protein product [Arabidopsis lyrata]|nr:unnamed protein product [Arabidopsis lyrata]